MTERALYADSLTKVYRVYPRPWDRLVELLTRRRRHRAFHALEGVGFELAPGESLGIIGENGAGKSTLLKILAGITAPTAGRVEVRGKVAAILELGSGFHPDFTGRQNILLNAAMLGLSQSELAEKMPAIVAFSELGEFIDQPVKFYSTGMSMRLGFSIATQVEPDVLIIDEALSVGDGYFQKKCMDRLLELTSRGTTLLLCSHAMYYLSAFCQRALWLRGGRVERLGPVAEVVREYEHFLAEKNATGELTAEASGRSPGQIELPEEPSPAKIVSVRQTRARGEPAGYRPGEAFELEIEWQCDDPALAFHVAVGVNRSDEMEVFSCGTSRDGLAPLTGRQRYLLALEIPRLPLVKGIFHLYVFLLDEEALHVYDRAILLRAFTVEPAAYSFGLMTVDHRWQLPRPARLAAAAPPERPRSVSSR